MNTEGRAAVLQEQNLRPTFTAILQRIDASNPEDARIIWAYVAALRAEAKSRRIECKALRVEAEVGRG